LRVVDGDPETGRGGRPHSSGQVRGADAKRAGERKVGTEHYGFMHNVEVWRWVKKEGGESGGEGSAGGGGWGHYGFMHNVEVSAKCVCGGEVGMGGGQDGDIMVLCIMSKCGGNVWGKCGGGGFVEGKKD
jgi:hypothetical protein